jgi:hypothetical protein
MIRNETTGPDGTVLTAEVIDLDAGTITFHEGDEVTGSRPLTADEVAFYTPPDPDPVAALQAQVAELTAALEALLGGTP